jgi:2-polyprenyl-6-methoxyphenol hydroxylase-like FAD-dependent oxidoreductase
MSEAVPVVVIGGGPVGLTLAMELARRGIETLILEKRERFELPEPRCNHVSARSMEIFRELGLADAIRASGMPDDHPHDVVYATRFAGYELSRLPIPSPGELRRNGNEAPDSWPTAEPPHRINQTFLEPVMWNRVTDFENIRIRWNTQAVSFEERDDLVRITAIDGATGKHEIIDALYLAGCDGSASSVRRALGVRLTGDDQLMTAMMATITAPDLPASRTFERAWMYWILNPDVCGNFITLDGERRWIVNVFLAPGMTPASLDFDGAVRALIGADVAFEVEHKKPWIGRRLLAERFATDRIFLAGDAAHSWLPMGGYAMNAGIADAANLAWKLAGVLDGWGGPGLLQSYERERRPVLEQVSSMVRDVRERQVVPIARELDDAGAAGDRARSELGRYMLETDSVQFACIGLNFGYFYDDSPVIVYDGSLAPPYSLGSYTPASVPGCRAPYFAIDGESIYDRIGAGFALLRFDRTIDVTAIKAARLPLVVIDVENRPAGYETGLVLVRPDQHIAWRGDTLPPALEELYGRVAGGVGQTAA